jgi:nitroreductase
MDAIFRRRSIRKYTAEDVSEADVEHLLRAAMAAPSAGNEQPWHFVVIRDRATLNAIPKFHPYAQMLREAPLAIVVCGDKALAKYEGYWVQDCSAAVENILIAATDRGLGACWLGLYPSPGRPEKTRELLGIPKHVTPLAAIAVGHPGEEKPPADRYDASRIHRDRW